MLTSQKPACDALYLDWNGGIHPAVRGLMAEFSKQSAPSRDVLERHMAERVVAYLHEVVRVARPQKMLYVAIDGVGPRVSSTSSARGGSSPRASAASRSPSGASTASRTRVTGTRTRSHPARSSCCTSVGA